MASYRVEPVSGAAGFGAILEVAAGREDEFAAAIDSATLRRHWSDASGLMVVRGFVSAERPDRMLQLGKLLGEVGARPAQHEDASLGTADWSEEVRTHMFAGFDENRVLGETAVDDVPLPPARNLAGESPLQWHTDMSFAEKPPKATMFYCYKAPSAGADTLFANTALGFASLPDELQAEARRHSALHAPHLPWAGGWAGAEGIATPPDPAGTAVSHGLVQVHPETGRECLYLSPENTIGIDGVASAEGREVVQQVVVSMLEHGGDECVYRHEWQEGDCIVWDNRQFIHKATTFRADDGARCMWRLSVREAELELTGEAVGGGDGADVTVGDLLPESYSSGHPSLDPSKEFVSTRGVPSKL